MKNRKTTKTQNGTIRIKAANLGAYDWKHREWRKSTKEFPEAMAVIELFKAHNNFDILIDTKKPVFLRGELSPEGKAMGARISVLPDRKKLGGAFSLFAKNLTIHDEKSNEHWDVIYQNPNGKFAYLYTLNKKQKASKQKYKKVKEFAKEHKKIMKHTLSALKNDADEMALPIYTLLKTMMRVGNEIYYKAHKHKGLTTLKKNDITIKGTNATFKFLSKNGVPRIITENFPKQYITRLKKQLKELKGNDFVFVCKNTGHPLKDTDFKMAFKKYCGKEFYPHIVRSYYATEQAEKFLKMHKKAGKKEIRELFTSIAEKLGHKKYSKKKHEWEDSYTVTVHHYIQPELVEKLRELAEKHITLL